MDDSEAALAAVEADAVTPSLDRVVEAVVLLSGLGFESGGLVTPHVLEKGLARLPGCDTMHGERVAFESDDPMSRRAGRSGVRDFAPLAAWLQKSGTGGAPKLAEENHHGV